jgi:hypothetical protein
MKNPKFLFGSVVLGLIILAVIVLANARLHQHLGLPGVKTQPLTGSKNLEIMLPETLPGLVSEIETNGEATLESYLPKDTSFRVRLYHAADNFFTQISVVLMGSDRTSIHRPEICLTGQGWAVDGAASKPEIIKMTQPVPYDLTVNKLVASKVIKDNAGNPQTFRGIYVFWYVDADHLTANQLKWMFWWMPRDLLLHGMLERWAYISYFSACAPGQEDATFERMKKMIATSVPQFQLVPRTGGGIND